MTDGGDGLDVKRLDHFRGRVCDNRCDKLEVLTSGDGACEGNDEFRGIETGISGSMLSSAGEGAAARWGSIEGDISMRFPSTASNKA